MMSEAAVQTRGRAWLRILPSVALFCLIATLLILGLEESSTWTTDVLIIGKTPAGESVLPPFPPLTSIDVYSRNGGIFVHHVYLLGSDGGGRDLLALLARGSLPSSVLIACALLGRLVIGIAAGIAMGLGSTIVRTVSRGMGRWIAGFPYLALAIVLVQALSPNPSHRTLVGLAAGMAMVGWRDVAELTAERIGSVLVEPYALAAEALGTQGVRFFRRHVMPHLRPALFIEIPLQASSVLVLLGELGYLGFYLGGNPLIWGDDSGGYRLVDRPELGQILSGARDYVLRDQWVPVLVPALALAAIALAFELFGHAMRARSGAGR